MLEEPRKSQYYAIATKKIKIWGKEALTFGAVISLPASKTDAITGGGALVVAEVVISRPAQVGTAGAVIMCVARDSVFVPHHGMR
jgi:ribosomal protein S8E